MPVLAAAVVENVKILPKFGVPEDGLKLGVTPPGAVPIHFPLNDTVLAVPEVSATETVVEIEPACWTERLSGDALIEKSNAGAAVVPLTPQ
ncbi:unnamed protein product [marine sediment metagenome]|uniref:Uncharacterized protein n=1 Tax=marine sediment metagenome TaxID=412755 RepID=X1LAX8_9ZZZZ